MKYITKKITPFILVDLFLEKTNEPRIAQGIPDSEKRRNVYPLEGRSNLDENDSRAVANKPGDNNATTKYFASLINQVTDKSIEKKIIPMNAPTKGRSRPKNFGLGVGSLLSLISKSLFNFMH